MAKINIAISPEENILALINAANVGLDATLSKVTIGLPVDMPGDDDRNTEVTLTAIANAGFSGTQTFSYTRRELAVGQAIGTAKPTSVAINANDSEAVILTKVANALGLMESELTLTDYVEAENEDVPGSASIVANNTSLLYTGTYSIALTIPDTDVPLTEAAPVTNLSGFDVED